MKIAVTASEASLEAQVDPQFGRCACFLIVDPDTMGLDAIENPGVALGEGAGIQAAQLLAEQAVEFVLTGHCGPNAHQALTAAGIRVMVGCSGVARDVVEQFKTGQFSPADQPDTASRSGTPGATDAPRRKVAPPGQPPGMGGGMGMGRGQGPGMGGGMGRRQGMQCGGGSGGAGGPGRGGGGGGGGRGRGRGRGGGGDRGRGRGGGRGR